MAKCFYCELEINKDNLTEIDGGFLRVCDECQKFIQKYGVEWFEQQIDLHLGNVQGAKQYMRFYDLALTTNGDRAKITIDGTDNFYPDKKV
jgi:NAD-dependent SIR2 family protein deacetylase